MFGELTGTLSQSLNIDHMGKETKDDPSKETKDDPSKETKDDPSKETKDDPSKEMSTVNGTRTGGLNRTSYVITV